MSLWAEYKRAYRDAHNWLALHNSLWWVVACLWTNLQWLRKMMEEQVR